MKHLFNLSCFLVLSLTAFSQNSRTFYRNNVQLNTGYTLYDGYKNLSINQKGMNRFTCLLSYDGFLTESFSIGAFGGFTTSFIKENNVYYSNYWTTNEGDYYTKKIKERRYFIGVKATTYFINTTNLQAYFGVGLAVGRKREYVRYGKEIYTVDNRSLVIMYDLHLGVNYYFSEHFGVTGSLGYPLSLFKVGVTYRY